MIPKPIYQSGDAITITAPGDYYNGQAGKISGLSPSTLKRRDDTKQWRYRVNFANGDWAYYAEKHIAKC